ncbi:MAG: class I SAM-dependent methyltransferase [Chitinophagales bacterium]
MVQIALKSESLIKWLYKIPIVKFFFVFKLSHLHKIKDKAVADMVYRLIYVTDGQTKQTAYDRFHDIDDQSASYIKEQGDASIHDLGASSGVTSLALYNKAKAKGANFDFCISDKFSKVYVQKGWLFTKVFDAEERLMLGYVGFLLASKSVKYFLGSHLLFSLLKLVPTNKKKWETVMLYDPEVIRFIGADEMTNIEYDVLTTPQPEQFSFVRCMNVLHTNYFSEAQIIIALENIKQSLKEGGILQLGRTHKRSLKNNVSFFQRQGDDFVQLQDMGEGTDIKHLVRVKETV